MNHLQEIAFGREQRELRIALTDDEQLAMKDELLHGLLELDRHAEALSAVKSEYKELMEPIRSKIGRLKSELRAGYRLETKTVYLVQNFDTGNMDYMTDDGEVVFSRRLLLSERQPNVLAISRGAQA